MMNGRLSNEDSLKSPRSTILNDKCRLTTEEFLEVASLDRFYSNNSNVKRQHSFISQSSFILPKVHILLPSTALS